MDLAQSSLEPDPLDVGLASEASRATLAFWEVAKLEVIKQKSRVRWLEGDDQNMAFFHHCVHSRQGRNELCFVVDSKGVRHTSPETVAEVAVAYFKGSWCTLWGIGT